MKSSSAKKKFDVLIVGAGLAGLVAGLQLQRAGKSVILIDKRSQVGGLCGTFFLNEHEFVIGCNDFGSGLIDLLKQLGVKTEFAYKKSFIYYRGSFYNSTPDLKLLWALRRHWKDIVLLIVKIIRQQFPDKKPESIEAFVDRCTSSGPVNDLAKVVAYFMGVPPRDLNTSFLGLDKKYKYKYTKMACPVGGPQKLSNSIADEFIKHGGNLRLNSRYVRHKKKNIFTIDLIENGQAVQLQTDYLVDTSERSAAYPEGTKRGLPLSMMCLVIDSRYPYPNGVHTFTYYQPGVSKWFDDLDKGKAAKEFGFHVFCSGLEQKSDCYTVNVYFYLPRGKESLTEVESSSYKEYLFSNIEKMLPDIRPFVRAADIITPEHFCILHGLSSRVMPFVWHGKKPLNESIENGLYYAGHTVNPPGDHAGAAALSGYFVAQSILTS